MGYYSDVAITLKREDMLCLFNEGMGYSDEVRSVLKYGKLTEPSEGILTLYISCIKWYSAFESISFIENFINELEDYHFLRVGEDANDNEERCGDGELSCDMSMYAYITREIQVYGADVDMNSIIKEAVGEQKGDEDEN